MLAELLQLVENEIDRLYELLSQPLPMPTLNFVVTNWKRRLREAFAMKAALLARRAAEG